MKRILLDENVPIGLVKLLSSFDGHHVHDLGWTGISDGDLIAKAEAAEFETLVTTDQSIVFQQRMKGRRLAFVVVDTNNWATIRTHHSLIATGLREAKPGARRDVLIRPPRRP